MKAPFVRQKIRDTEMVTWTHPADHVGRSKESREKKGLVSLHSISPELCHHVVFLCKHSVASDGNVTSLPLLSRGGRISHQQKNNYTSHDIHIHLLCLLAEVLGFFSTPDKCWKTEAREFYRDRLLP